MSGAAGDIKTVSCVSFNSDGPDKTKYRFFRVPADIANSDLDSLVFGVKKYLKSIGDVDLLLIDGGKTHMNYVKELFDIIHMCFAAINQKQIHITY